LIATNADPDVARGIPDLEEMQRDPHGASVSACYRVPA